MLKQSKCKFQWRPSFANSSRAANEIEINKKNQCAKKYRIQCSVCYWKYIRYAVRSYKICKYMKIEFVWMPSAIVCRLVPHLRGIGTNFARVSTVRGAYALAESIPAQSQQWNREASEWRKHIRPMLSSECQHWICESVSRRGKSILKCN